MAGPQRRRRRPAVSCVPCRNRKVRCDRGLPCKNCLRARNATCVYETLSPPPSPRRQMADLAPRPQPSQQYPSPASVAGSGVTLAPSTESQSSAAISLSLSEYEALKSRIRQLEERLSVGAATSHDVSPSVLNNSVIGTLFIHQRGQPSSLQKATSQSITCKGRMFGQSHWLNAFVLIRDMFETLELHMRTDKTALLSVERCKYMARAIKTQRAPLWPTPLTTDLPSRDVCDRLIDLYLQTTESVYRVLHVPSFKQQYESLWNATPNSDTEFLVQLKLVLAIGATVYDDTYSLRTFAIRCIYEAQAFRCEPEFKPRLTIQSLQIHILLLFARHTANIGGSLVWISVGELVRTAIFMGLHRDPSRMPNATVYECEMRRRLWNTVLEIVLRTAVDSGGPPLISAADFDTEPPRNLSDDQLLKENGVQEPGDGFTETSIARALRATFPTRLAIVKYLNDLESKGTYEDTLNFDKELRAAHKSMDRELEASQPHGVPMFFDVGLKLANFIMASYISILHTPFLAAAFRDPAYAFSRMALLQNSLKLWPILFPTSSLASHDAGANAPASDIWTRLTVCDHRTFHVAVKQAYVVFVTELRAGYQNEGIGTVPFSVDLLDALRDVTTRTFDCVKAGETNIKSHVGASLALAYAEGTKRGLQKEEHSKYLAQTLEDAAEACLPVLQSMLGPEDGQTGLGDMRTDLPTPSEGLDLDCILPFSDLQQLGAWDPLGWALEEEIYRGTNGC